MKLPLFQIDAFEEGPFTGNPAAVVPLEEPLDDGLMQRIAEENNLSETAFTAPIPDAEEPSFALRWFTPTTEVDLCGHATLAAAAALRDMEALRGASLVHFSTRSGPLVAHLEGSGEVSIDLPAALPEAAPGPGQLDAIERALDAPVESVFLHRYALAILPSEGDVRGLSPGRTCCAGPRSRSSRPRPRTLTTSTSSAASSLPPSACPRTRSPAPLTASWSPTGPLASERAS